ncbi:MAG TPA: L,D-transpeptidase family protein [Pilimelia sp.]|nr:L,D-transpeptidase family protein [Pilimelia sp.]
MGRVGWGLRLLVLAVVTLVGAGACAFGAQRNEPGVSKAQPVTEAPGATGASATPGSDQESSPSRTKPAAVAAAPTCPQGEHQRAVEAYLKKIGRFGPVIVDGKQSATDCAAIKKFQLRFGIRPAAGRAGPTTVDVARRIANTDTKACRAGTTTSFCVDLTHQTVWVMKGGKVVLGPTVTRTGMAGYRTPAGTFEINYRTLKEWSNPYEVWMPYWQRFYGGMGFHETTTYIHNKAIGSHGCVNLLPSDAKAMWKLGKTGTRVYLFGARP